MGRGRRSSILPSLLLLVLLEEQWAALAAEIDTGGLSRKSFPKGFVFGTATSAYQVEGMAHGDGRGPSIWDEFIKKPGIVKNNGTGDVAVDQYHRYKVNECQSMNFWPLSPSLRSLSFMPTEATVKSSREKGTLLY